MRQQVIAKIIEARVRIEQQSAKAQEIRAGEDLGPQRKQQALDEVTGEARTRVTQLIRDARYGARGGWSVGAGGIGLPVRAWDEGLSPQGLAARDAMLGYIDAAERVISVELEELEAGEAPSAEAAASRSAAAAEVASFEEAHSAPAGVAPAGDRLPTIR